MHSVIVPTQINRYKIPPKMVKIVVNRGIHTIGGIDITDNEFDHCYHFNSISPRCKYIIYGILFLSFVVFVVVLILQLSTNKLLII